MLLAPRDQESIWTLPEMDCWVDWSKEVWEMRVGESRDEKTLVLPSRIWTVVI